MSYPTRSRRNPEEVTYDRLMTFLEQHGDELDGSERDEISHVMHILYEYAEGTRP